MEQGLDNRIMRGIKTGEEAKYVSPELEVVVFQLKNGIFQDNSQTEQIIDDPEGSM